MHAPSRLLVTLLVAGSAALLAGCGPTQAQLADQDNDGIADQSDNCPAVPNPPRASGGLQEDRDEDGVGDACDNCATVVNPDQADTDGLANSPDEFDPTQPRTHPAGDACDADRDGVADRADNCATVFNPDQADANRSPMSGVLGVGDACDADQDEADDAVDNCPGQVNNDQADVDGDGKGDPCDPDDDDDGVCDPLATAATCTGSDNCPLVANADQADADGDSVGDACDADTDRDGDGVIDAQDNCPAQANADQADFDGDGLGDACDPDRDGDSRPDELDNCPGVPNNTQADLDGDGLGNACDDDRDGDARPNTMDNCPDVTNATQADGDGDGVGDACDANVDADGDGVDDSVDNCPGVANPRPQLDTDADGQGDGCDTDDDGDGRDDASDNCPLAVNPTQENGDGDPRGDACDNCVAVTNVDQADGDADGVGTVCDNCPAAANATQADGDGDAAGDACDGTYDYAGFVSYQLMKQDIVYESNDGIYIGAIFGTPGYPRSYMWHRSAYFGFTIDDTLPPKGTWVLRPLLAPFGPGDFTSVNGGSAVQFTTPGVAISSVSWDTTTYAGFSGYYNASPLPSNRYAYDARYTISIPGGPGLPAFTAPNALRTPQNFTVSPDPLAGRQTVYQDSPVTFTWTPAAADAGTQFVFRASSGDKILVYEADDSAGTLTVPAAELGKLAAGPALLTFSRYTNGEFKAAGKPYQVHSEVIQQGYANLVPACTQREAEPNDLPGAANAVTGALGSDLNVCGTYGARGDLDAYRISAVAGQVLSARVYAADLGSTLDSVLELTAPDGRVFTNDNATLGTNDSALLQVIDQTGDWVLRVGNAAANRAGGPAFFYNLLLRQVSVPGAAFAFPGTLEGTLPLPSCYDVTDSSGIFLEGTAAVCELTVSGAPTTATDVNLLVDIPHAYPSDIRLSLTHPDGTTVLLTNHTGRTRGVFDIDFPPDDRAQTMAAFEGKDPNGTWVLRASDWYAFDVGRVRSAVLLVKP